MGITSMTSSTLQNCFAFGKGKLRGMIALKHLITKFNTQTNAIILQFSRNTNSNNDFQTDWEARGLSSFGVPIKKYAQTFFAKQLFEVVRLVCHDHIRVTAYSRFDGSGDIPMAETPKTRSDVVWTNREEAPLRIQSKRPSDNISLHATIKSTGIANIAACNRYDFCSNVMITSIASVTGACNSNDVYNANETVPASISQQRTEK